MKNVFILFFFSLLLPVTGLAKDYNILAFGAVPDGKTLNTTAIQSAIDKAHAKGGGRLIIPKGRFLSGSIVLKSGVEIHLLEGAVLLGSVHDADYQRINRWKALVLADQQTDLAITGKGTIDGQGRQLALSIDSLFYIGQLDSSDYTFPEMRPKVMLRPQIIDFVKCKNIRVTGVTIQNSACWVQTYDRCENLILDSIRVISDAYWNNDGIDIMNCKNVRITNSYVDASDDGICLKSNRRDAQCDSVYIANCVVRSSASGVKLGTGSIGGFRNVHIENIKIFDTFRSAIAIESVDGAIIENVFVNNIEAVNTGNAIFIRLGFRFKKWTPGTIKNVVIKNLKAEICFERPDYAYDIRGPALPFFHNIFPSSITGIPGHPVESVHLENIEIIYPGRGNKGLAYLPLTRLADIPEEIEKYPEFSMFGELPAWGLYGRHINQLSMENISIAIKAPDYRPAMVFDDVEDLKIKSLDIIGDKKADPIFLENVRQAEIED